MIQDRSQPDHPCFLSQNKYRHQLWHQQRHLHPNINVSLDVGLLHPWRWHSFTRTKCSFQGNTKGRLRLGSFFLSLAVHYVAHICSPTITRMQSHEASSPVQLNTSFDLAGPGPMLNVTSMTEVCTTLVMMFKTRSCTQ